MARTTNIGYMLLLNEPVILIMKRFYETDEMPKKKKRNLSTLNPQRL
jgi:hypothetical protein